MRYSNPHNRRTYWTVQMLLMAPVILMWCGVAYWFGFASEVILKLAFPPMLAPAAFSLLLLTALAWTLWHRSRVPRWRPEIRRIDTAICVFIAFSMLLVIGQIMGM
ncbi:MAG: hypothetical protein QM785_06955 [Pyrinomonadaceae bacterium]